MILPNVRASFGREEAGWLVGLLADEDSDRAERYRRLLADRGIDSLLDDPETRDRILEEQGFTLAPEGLVLYVLVRHSLLEVGVESRVIADYVTALVLEFGQGRRARQVHEYDEREYGYLVEIMEDMVEASGRRAFLLRAHLGNFALWLSGLFPDYIVNRVYRKGGPGLDYYEEMGQTGYRMAAADPHAEERALGDLYRGAADHFGELRRGLNDFSDRYLLPRPSSPVDRLLRQVGSRYDSA